SPANTAFGPSEVAVGIGLSIVKLSPPEIPPPGAGVETVTSAVPPAAISAVVIVACKLVQHTNVVARAVPFHCTVEAFTKLLPVTVRANAPPPATAELGFSDPIARDGLGLDWGGGGPP